VQQHVGIAMADQLAVVRNIDPPQPQWTSRPQPMRIVPDSDASDRRGLVSRPGRPWSTH
jgi:hypothetical protein